MAEVAGFVVGGVGLAALFDSCMNAFNYVESAANYGKDYRKMALRISLLQNRLSRWAVPIDFVDDSGPNQVHIKVASAPEVEQVWELLGEILANFEAAETASKRYKLKTSDTSTERPNIETLAKRLQNLAMQRQKHSSVGQKAMWALHDKTKFSRLVEDLNISITSLEKLFPVLRQKLDQLAASEVETLIQPSEIEEPGEGEESVVHVLEEAAKYVDESLRRAIIATNSSNSTHRFGNIDVVDTAHVMRGDYIAEGSKRDARPGNTYGDTKASGQARVHDGNNWGGPYVLD